MHHPWHWFTYGLNSSAVQAVAAVVATIAAIVAALYAKGAYRETQEQVAIANRQLEIARASASQDFERLEMERKAHARSEQQLQIAIDEAHANRERDAREREEAKSLLIAEEDRTRPRFDILYSGSSALYDVGLANVGETTARNVVCKNRSGSTQRTSTAIQPGAKLDFQATKSTLEDGFIVSFETDRGSRYSVDLKLGRHPEEEITSVVRGY